jgi:hypothetical protein
VEVGVESPGLKIKILGTAEAFRVTVPFLGEQLPVSVATQASDNVIAAAQATRTMAADSDHHKIAEHALAMLKVLYRREGPCAVVESAKHMVVAAAAVISQELGPAEARRFLHVVGDTQGEPVH